jgi:hypothetical protein
MSYMKNKYFDITINFLGGTTDGFFEQGHDCREAHSKARASQNTKRHFRY